jgi:hypothetical protein
MYARQLYALVYNTHKTHKREITVSVSKGKPTVMSSSTETMDAVSLGGPRDFS